MDKIAAFVGHSFSNEDRAVVRKFTDFFDHVRDLGIGFSWDHAEGAEPKELSQKVVTKMIGKNVFIGICTPKEKVISPEMLRSLIVSKQLLFAFKNDFSSKTSDWILQEIGYALGKDMKIMLLLESDVRRPGGLQGDVEYIQFDRDNPEQSFSKILEMLKSLRPTLAMGERAQISKAGEAEVTLESAGEARAADSESTSGWRRDDYERSLFFAIRAGDQVKEQDISDKYKKTQEGQTEYEQVAWRGLRLYYHRLLKNEKTLEQLLELSRTHSTHGGISFLLGRLYESYHEYGKAANCLKQSAINARSEDEKLIRLCRAAEAASREIGAVAVESLLTEAKALVPNVVDAESVLLETIANISSICNDDESFIAFSEALLHKKPEEHDLRFSLAFKCSRLKQNEMSLYHYRILAKQNPNEVVWNNLGVAQDRLGLNSKAVESFRESENLGGTLAMGNLALKLIDAGFLKEAKELCNLGIKIENYDPQLGTAIARISEVSKSDETKELELIEATSKRRLFFADYARACLTSQTTKVEGLWQSPDCELKLRVANAKMEAVGHIGKQENSFSPSPPFMVSVPPFDVKYLGRAFGYGITYKRWLYMTGTGLEESKPTSEGFMILSNDLKTLKVYERGSLADEKFYQMTQVEKQG